MKILVTGANGQVDTSIRNCPTAKNHEIITIGRPEIDLSEYDKLKSTIKKAMPDVIISSAAYTAVDRAESDAELAYSINALAPQAIGEVAAEIGVPVIHLSTDYVFSGDKIGAYIETDSTGPIGIYGKTKLEGEKLLAGATSNHVILRTAWVYSPYGNNFVKTMLRLGETRDELNVVADQYGCPTYAPEIARACIAIAERILMDKSPKLRGIFHLTGQGKANWAEFAKTIFLEAEKYTRNKVTINEITTDQYPTPAKRPANSLLSTQKLYDVYGLELDDWQKSTKECVNLLLDTANNAKE